MLNPSCVRSVDVSHIQNIMLLSCCNKISVCLELAIEDKLSTNLHTGLFAFHYCSWNFESTYGSSGVAIFKFFKRILKLNLVSGLFGVKVNVPGTADPLFFLTDFGFPRNPLKVLTDFGLFRNPLIFC